MSKLRNPYLDFFYSFQESDEIFVSYKIVKTLLDILWIQSEVKKANYPELFEKKGVGIPFNCLIATCQDEVVIGIASSNVIVNFQQLLLLETEFTDVDLAKKAIEFGFKSKFKANIDMILVINKYDIDLIRSSINKAYDKEGYVILNLLNILKNNLDEKWNAFERIQQSVINAVEEMIRKDENTLYINPIFKAREMTVDKNLVFCALEFNDKQLELFQEIIRPHLENAFGFQVIKANDIMSNRSIIEDVWNYIYKARIVIVDISNKNPNVFYELGICHTLGKETIIICSEKSLKEDFNNKFPFDIVSIRTIIYKTELTGPEKLKKDLSDVIESIISGEDVIR